MAIRLGPDPDSFFHLESSHSSKKGELSVQRVILAAKRGAGRAATVPYVRAAPVPEEGIQLLKELALTSVKSQLAESKIFADVYVESLADFLIHLEDSSCPEELLKRKWDSLPESVRKLLGGVEGNFRELLCTVNELGNNRVEQLIEHLHRARDYTAIIGE